MHAADSPGPESRQAARLRGGIHEGPGCVFARLARPKHDAIVIRHKRDSGVTASGVSFPSLAIGEEYVIETEHEADASDLKRGLILRLRFALSTRCIHGHGQRPTRLRCGRQRGFRRCKPCQVFDRETWIWRARSLEPLAAHVSLDIEDVRPRVAVSFSKDFAASMQAIARRYQEIEARSTKMRSVAQSIAKPGDTPQQKAQAALTWIQRNITYTSAPEFVDDTLLPGEVDQTIKRGKGMCRDLVAAYGALLRELNVQSEPVFVNTRSSGNRTFP